MGEGEVHSARKVCTNIGECQEFLTDSGLRVIHQNIQGYCKKFPAFKENTLDKLAFDVIILSECQIKDKIDNNYVIPLDSYQVFVSTNHQVKSEGVLVYVKQSLKPSEVKIAVTDGNVVSFYIQLFGEKWLVLALYRPQPGKIKKQPFVESLNSALSTQSQCKNILLIGDTNLNIVSRSNKTRQATSEFQAINDYLRYLAGHGLVSTVNQVTRPASETCLDHVMVKTKHDVISAVYHSETSDHYATITSIKRRAVAKISMRRFSFRLPQKQCDLGGVLENEDANAMLKEVLELCKDYISAHKPQENIRDLINRCQNANQIYLLLKTEPKLSTIDFSGLEDFEISTEVFLNIFSSHSPTNYGSGNFALARIEKNDIVRFSAMLMVTEGDRRIFGFLALCLHDLLNTFIDQNVFPDPSLQNGDHISGVIFRNVFGVYELAIVDQLKNFLLNGNKLSEKQLSVHGKAGMNDALGKVVSFVITAIDRSQSSKFCLGLFIHLDSDNVERKYLKKKLTEVGIRGKVNKLLLDLYDKSSMLRQTVSMIYLNDLLNLPIKGEIVAFSTQIVILFAGKTWENICNEANESLDEILSKYPSFSVRDIQYIPFSITLAGQPKKTLEIRGGTIAREVSYLGITIDRHLRWETQLEDIIRNGNKIISVMRGLGKIKRLKEKEKKHIYCILWEAAARNVIIWGSARKTLMKIALQTQSSVIAALLDKKVVNDPLEEAGLFDIYEMFVKEMLLYLYRNNRSVKEFIDQKAYQRETISLEIPQLKSKKAQNSFMYLAPVLFNKINFRSMKDTDYRTWIEMWISKDGREIIKNQVKL